MNILCASFRLGFEQRVYY